MSQKERQLLQLNEGGFFCNQINFNGSMMWYVEFHYNGWYQKYGFNRQDAVACIWEQVASRIINKIIDGDGDGDGDGIGSS